MHVEKFNYNAARISQSRRDEYTSAPVDANVDKKGPLTLTARKALAAAVPVTLEFDRVRPESVTVGNAQLNAAANTEPWF